MKDQLSYNNLSDCLDFDALILDSISLPGNRTGIILDTTYFYPTGGGQEHDTGTLGSAHVIDVFKDESNRIIHVVDQPIPLGPVHARIDAERRLRHMQHHTAQHLLSQCFVQLFNLETLSANINGYTPSTVDLKLSNLSKADFQSVEDLANQIIYENRPVKTYQVAPELIHTIPLRRPPKVSENIRIVEIGGFDYSACGGTHCSSTGMIGIMKILKVEKQNDKSRVFFNAGLQARQTLSEAFEIVSTLAVNHSVHPQDLLQTLQRQAEQLKNLQKENQTLLRELITFEAERLSQAALTIDNVRLVMASFENRPVKELRSLAEELKLITSIVSILISQDTDRFSLVVSCASSTHISARGLLAQLLAPLHGRGGGDDRLAQGGAPLPKEQLSAYIEHIKQFLPQILRFPDQSI